MRGLLTLVLVAMLSGCASVAPRAKLAHAAYIATAITDIASTQAALGRGAVEKNPFLGENPSTVKMVALKVAGFAFMRTLENVLEEQLGRVLRWYEQALLWFIPVGLQSWATIHNHGASR